MKKTYTIAAAFLILANLMFAQEDKKAPHRSRSAAKDTTSTLLRPQPVRAEKIDNTSKAKSSRNAGQPQPVRSTGKKED